MTTTSPVRYATPIEANDLIFDNKTGKLAIVLEIIKRRTKSTDHVGHHYRIAFAANNPDDEILRRRINIKPATHDDCLKLFDGFIRKSVTRKEQPLWLSNEEKGMINRIRNNHPALKTIVHLLVQNHETDPKILLSMIRLTEQAANQSEDHVHSTNNSIPHTGLTQNEQKIHATP